METPFEAPIPGESLTTTPGNQPFERPPEIVDPEEAIQMHLSRLSEPERLEGVVDAIELGTDIKSLTTGYLRSAVANGIHSFDVSLMIAPVIHENFKSIAKEAGIEFEEGFVDEKKEAKRRRQIEYAKARRKLEKARDTKSEEIQEIDTPVDVEEPELGDQPQGFMKRRGEV